MTLNQRWAATIIGTLVSHGVKHFVIAPGSRSTPLALAVADRDDVKRWSIIDERSAAFFALGLAKGAGAPAAVICTSGTAGAHFLPAVMEAQAGAVPLVLLTADRPWELHGFGAPQTIAQQGLFGRYVLGAEALPSPEEETLTHLSAVLAKLLSSGRGPVHVNVPFREPLAPSDGSSGPRIEGAMNRAPTELHVDLSEVRRAIAAAKRGLIVCGPRERNDGFGAWVHELAAKTGFPVLAEAASNARFGFPGAITFADALLRNERFAQAMKPDVVLRFGGGLTPKTPQAWLDDSDAVQFHFVDDGALFDPLHRATAVLPFTRALLNIESSPSTEQRDYAAAWRRAQQHLDEVWHAQQGELTEPLIAREFIAAFPAGANAFLSSSMPIRDVDAFASRGAALRVFANRGVNGIDGITSSALGVAAATRAPTALLTGDVALLHDLHAWLIAKQQRLDFTAVVVNNDGGGIFHFLPVAERTTHFEELFGTPHGADLSHVAALGGATLHRPLDVETFRSALQRALRGGLHLIEVKTNRAANVAAHRALFARLQEAVP